MWIYKSWLFVLVLVYTVWQLQANRVPDPELTGVMQWKLQKRPFCNAFTGCGKKRSSYPPYPMLKRAELDNDKGYLAEDLSEAGLADLIDINAEPAVENVQKQIMSQAKIYEAIKEASKEIFRQKTQQKLRNQQHHKFDEPNMAN